MLRDNLGEEEEGGPEERRAGEREGQETGESGGGGGEWWGRGRRKRKSTPLRRTSPIRFPTEGKITLRGESSILGNVQVRPGG